MKNKFKTQQTKDKNSNQYKYERRQRKGIVGPFQIGGAALGSALGSLGGPAGAAVGGLLGGAIGNGIGYYTGTGDYKVYENAVTAPGYKGSDSTTIMHREYIGDIYSGAMSGGATAFDIQKFPLNPGLPQTFPWLASIASNYEEYDIQGMLFAFVSTSGESVAAANTTLGTIIMATEYDPTKPDFVNKQAMENYSFAISGKPSRTLLHAIECKKVRTPVKQLYVRNGANSADLRWTDFGNFYVATVGCQAAGVNLGELWVTYKVKLLKPRLPITVGLGGQIASAFISRSGVTTALPLGDTSTTAVGSIVPVFNAGTVSWPVLPNMNYFIEICVYAATSASVVAATATTNLTPMLLLKNRTLAAVDTGGTTIRSKSTWVYQASSVDTDSSASITVTCTVVGAATVDVFITQMDETVI